MNKNGRSPFWQMFFTVFIVSVLLSAAVIFVANDVFAFVSGEEKTTVIIPEGANAADVSDILEEKGLIRFPLAFRLYADLRAWGEEYLAGEFTLDDAMSYDELRYALSPKKGVRLQQKVTIPEGLTTDEIIEIFVSLGIGTKEGFVAAIENGGNFGYDFLDDIPNTEERTYRLDGYLFPDTYFVYADSTETEILSKLLSNFNRKFDGELRSAAAMSGYTVDEIVRLASIIEREAYYRSDMPLIASVFRNRLGSSRFPYLESDATVKYVKLLAGNTDAPSPEDLDGIESPYNTYKTQGLPPGAICSPGYDALLAAIHPAETEYYYFVSAKDKTTVFSKTYAEHMRAVASLR